MRFEDALKLMREGKKVWINKGRGKPQYYFYIDTVGDNGKQVLKCYSLLMETSSFVNQFSQDTIMSTAWEEYKKPILDDVEKKYLENFLRPYTKRFDKIKITKINMDGGRFYIRISFFAFKDGELTDYICLPFFDKDEHMYEGLDEGKHYTPDELGLFKK